VTQAFFFGALFNIVVLMSFAQASNAPYITHGVASGDVTDNSAVIWTRPNKEAYMHLQYGTSLNFTNGVKSQVTLVNQSAELVGNMKLDNLEADTLYYYRVWFSPTGDDTEDYKKNIGSMIGQFRTAPDESSNRNVTLIIGGDLGGHELCRRVGIGYLIFQAMKTLSPDFFIFNGDQIYADLTCPESNKRANFTGWYNIPGNFSAVTNTSEVNWNNISQLHEVYSKHWEYNRSDPHLQRFLQSTSMYSQADDHEVIDNYGGEWTHYWADKYENTKGYPNLIKIGIETFFKFSPIDRNKEDPNRIYRSFNWGKFLDLFLLDAHSYRSRSDLPDTPENNKTLYGKEQLRWLEQGLLNSKAVWKVISSPVPITIPHCFAIKDGLGCDNWATNTTDTKVVNQTYIRERQEFLRYLDKENIKNVIIIATDVHFAANLRIEQDFDGDGDMLIYHEMVSGPLSAAIHEPYPPDPTINAKYLYREAGTFNFGYMEIKETGDQKVHLLYKVVDVNNYIRPNSYLDLLPQ
jgi:alkaline phosphatase D